MEMSLEAWLSDISRLSFIHLAHSWARYLANFRGRDKNDSATDLALGRLYINMCLGISRKQFLSNLFVGLSCVICIPLIKHLSSLRENDIHTFMRFPFSLPREPRRVFWIQWLHSFVCYWVPSSRKSSQETIWPQILFSLFFCPYLGHRNLVHQQTKEELRLWATFYNY